MMLVSVKICFRGQIHFPIYARAKNSFKAIPLRGGFIRYPRVIYHLHMYGHPHDETLERLEEAGAGVIRTDESGAIEIRVIEDKLQTFVYGDGIRQRNPI